MRSGCPTPSFATSQYKVATHVLSRWSGARGATASIPLLARFHHASLAEEVGGMLSPSAHSWIEGETLGEHLEEHGVSRRDFLEYCAELSVVLGVGSALALAAPAQRRPLPPCVVHRPLANVLQRLRVARLANVPAYLLFARCHRHR